MKITPDTNVLVRVLTRDDEKQGRIAEAARLRAETLALTLPMLCELVRVLSRLYRQPPAVIAHEGRRLGGDMFVAFDRDAVAPLKARKQPASLLA